MKPFTVCNNRWYVLLLFPYHKTVSAKLAPTFNRLRRGSGVLPTTNYGKSNYFVCRSTTGGHTELFCGRFLRSVSADCFNISLNKAEMFILVNNRGVSLIIYTGDSPYPGVKAREVTSLLERGYRMSRPIHISEEL